MSKKEFNSDVIYSTAKNTLKKMADIHNIAGYAINPSAIGAGMAAAEIAILAIKNYFALKENSGKELYYKENPLYKPIHDICKQLALDCYKDYNIDETFKNFKRFSSIDDKETGFFSTAYINSIEKEIIIAFRGTQPKSIKDIQSDFEMGIKNSLPKQFFMAEKFYNDVKSMFKEKINDYTIYFTGHSLGGSISELMGAKYGNYTITFNAYGVGNIKNIDANFSDNIINYGNKDDFVFNANGCNHIGITVETSNEQQEKLNCGIRILKYHSIKNMGDLPKTT